MSAAAAALVAAGSIWEKAELTVQGIRRRWISHTVWRDVGGGCGCGGVGTEVVVVVLAVVVVVVVVEVEEAVGPEEEMPIAHVDVM